MKKLFKKIEEEALDEIETKDEEPEKVKKTFKEYFEDVKDWCEWHSEQLVGGTIAVAWGVYCIWLIRYLRQCDRLLDLEVALKAQQLDK